MSYREIEQAVAKSERAGGYAHIVGPDGDYFEVIDGDGTIQIGPGRDAITFLQIALRRSLRREVELQGNADYDGEALKQQLEDGRREVAEAVAETLGRFER